MFGWQWRLEKLLVRGVGVVLGTLRNVKTSRVDPSLSTGGWGCLPPSLAQEWAVTMVPQVPLSAGTYQPQSLPCCSQPSQYPTILAKVQVNGNCSFCLYSLFPKADNSSKDLMIAWGFFLGNGSEATATFCAFQLWCYIALFPSLLSFHAFRNRLLKIRVLHWFKLSKGTFAFLVTQQIFFHPAQPRTICYINLGSYWKNYKKMQKTDLSN